MYRSPFSWEEGGEWRKKHGVAAARVAVVQGEPKIRHYLRGLQDPRPSQAFHRSLATLHQSSPAVPELFRLPNFGH
ncbi:hypothetical protein FIBSPDRAFT_850854 [Athelia psychrophila]|uniref:Uncharacterized protein n=1 Tax=Athelia psychrophila TaxID=1759441 RepID=A0A166T362_9AGAM|nr:hypothetical protein FIBSPDRAFT_850854 [Fibularhizoctonia sp. CBS 109695]